MKRFVLHLLVLMLCFTAILNYGNSAVKADAKSRIVHIKSGNYEIQYLKYQKITSIDGKPGILIYFNFKNKSKEAAEFLDAFTPEVYQKGIESDTYVMFENAPKEFEDRGKKIKDGANINICFSFSLQNTKSNIELEVTDQNTLKTYKQSIKIK